MVIVFKFIKMEQRYISSRGKYMCVFCSSVIILSPDCGPFTSEGLSCLLSLCTCVIFDFEKIKLLRELFYN